MILSESNGRLFSYLKERTTAMKKSLLSCNNAFSAFLTKKAAAPANGRLLFSIRQKATAFNYDRKLCAI